MTVCDVFCNIIDNYGDIGVCWRLARQLHREYGLSVRLWVNDLHSFARLAPMVSTRLSEQDLGGISVRTWPTQAILPEPGAIVIEGFGCALPSGWLDAMRTRQPRPLWLNLEYLSAEPWVEGCHGLASVHPGSGLTQHFWFPGFTPGSGGLLRERDLLAGRASFQPEAFWARIGLPDAPGFDRRISLFSYANPALPRLLDALISSNNSTLLVVPEGKSLPGVAAWLGTDNPSTGSRHHRGALTIAIIPLLSHEDYDRLLWSCELNAVRGEDSFVRAQWAGRPLLWHIYPQEEAAHLIKLEAFISLRAEIDPVWAEAMRAWNGTPTGPEIWQTLLSALPALETSAQAWAAHLAAQPDLSTGLMHFYRSQVE